MARKNEAGLRSQLNPEERRGDRLANAAGDLLGSVWFLLLCLSLIAVYLLWNTGRLGFRIFDPAPFDQLDTFLSIFAIILSISVLISQKRQRKLEKVREQVEFEVNVRAEHEITKLLAMLHGIQQKLGIDKPDQELEEMKKETDILALHQDIQNDL